MIVPAVAADGADIRVAVLRRIRDYQRPDFINTSDHSIGIALSASAGVAFILTRPYELTIAVM